MSALSFSTGQRFVYWDYHKKHTQNEIEEQDLNATYEQRNGHSIGSLLVSPFLIKT